MIPSTIKVPIPCPFVFWGPLLLTRATSSLANESTFQSLPLQGDGLDLGFSTTGEPTLETEPNGQVISKVFSETRQHMQRVREKLEHKLTNIFCKGP